MKRHACPICEKMFLRPQHVQAHVDAVHLKLKMHQCPHCAYASSTSANLTRHVRTRHSGPHLCTRCGARFTMAQSLKKHGSRCCGATPSETPCTLTDEDVDTVMELFGI